MRRIVAGKLHCIHVTDANIDYHGSVTLDPDHCEQAGILHRHHMVHATAEQRGLRAPAAPGEP